MTLIQSVHHIFLPTLLCSDSFLLTTPIHSTAWQFELFALSIIPIVIVTITLSFAFKIKIILIITKMNLIKSSSLIL